MSQTPQLEDGYTRLANALLDALLAARLTARQWQVVMVIIRKTYGYNKKEDDISASQIGACCAMNRTHVTETLNQLARMNIISKRPGVHGSILSMQKNSALWGGDQAEKSLETHYVYRVTHAVTGEFVIGTRTCKCHPNQDRFIGSGDWVAAANKALLNKEVLAVFESREAAEQEEHKVIQETSINPLQRNAARFTGSTRTESGQVVQSVDTRTDSVQGVQESDLARTDSVQVDRTDSVHTKDNLPKDKEQKTKSIAPQATRENFEKFYSAFPKKKSRAQAEKAFAKINPDEQLLTAILAGLQRAMKSGQWQDPQYIPYPASWLNAKGWEDEVQTEYSEPERAVIQAFNDALGEQLGRMDEAIFVESRAAAIRTFLTFSAKHGFWQKFFLWVRENCDLPPRVGFDWLISADGFTKVKGGQHTKRSVA
jgi:phage replication O-like protein O